MEVTTVPLCWITCRNQGSAGVPSCTFTNSSTWNCPIFITFESSNKEKRLFHLSLFCRKNWEEHAVLEIRPGSGQLFLLLSLMSKAPRSSLSHSCMGSDSYPDSQPALRDIWSTKKMGMCHNVCRRLSISKPYVTPTPYSKNSLLVGAEGILFPYTSGPRIPAPTAHQSTDWGNLPSFPVPGSLQLKFVLVQKSKGKNKDQLSPPQEKNKCLL